MTNTETDRIQNAIRHIQTAVDVDSWAMKIAVDAMEKMIPVKPMDEGGWLVCPNCKKLAISGYCRYCGHKLSWTEDEG